MAAALPAFGVPLGERRAVHEYTLIKNLLESVERDLAAKGVAPQAVIREVAIKVGALEIHSREACRQAFAMLAHGTRLDNSELKLEIVPARLKCPECGRESELAEDAVDGHEAHPIAQCPGCGTVAPVIGGRGVEALEVRLEE